jgi:hypothetical protein
MLVSLASNSHLDNEISPSHITLMHQFFSLIVGMMPTIEPKRSVKIEHVKKNEGIFSLKILLFTSLKQKQSQE